MHNDDQMDALLRTTFTTPPPTRSPQFTRTVVHRTTPRRLSRPARVVVGTYIVAATVVCAWLLRELPPVVLLIALSVQAGIAIGLRGYLGSLVRQRSA